MNYFFRFTEETKIKDRTARSVSIRKDLILGLAHRSWRAGGMAELFHHLDIFISHPQNGISYLSLAFLSYQALEAAVIVIDSKLSSEADSVFHPTGEDMFSILAAPFGY